MSCEGMELLLALCFASTARSHLWPRTPTDSHLPLFFFVFFPSLQVLVLCLSLLLLFFYIVLSAPAAPSLSIPVVVVAACTVLVVSGALHVPCLGINCDVEAQEAQEA